MRIHICDTSVIPGHGCCGGFIWPDEIQVLCGKMVPFQPVQVETIDGDEERFCKECLHGLRTRTARTYESICTIAESSF